MLTEYFRHFFFIITIKLIYMHVRHTNCYIINIILYLVRIDILIFLSMKMFNNKILILLHISDKYLLYISDKNNVFSIRRNLL